MVSRKIQEKKEKMTNEKTMYTPVKLSRVQAFLIIDKYDNLRFRILFYLPICEKVLGKLQRIQASFTTLTLAASRIEEKERTCF